MIQLLALAVMLLSLALVVVQVRLRQLERIVLERDQPSESAVGAQQTSG